MANESYSDIGVNNNLINLKGYISQENNDFKLANKGISSWSFDGSIPIKTNYVELWNRDLGKFNVKPGQYILLTDDPLVPVARPIVRVRIEDGKRFFNKVDSTYVDGLSNIAPLQITNIVGNGTKITYTVNNTISVKDRVTISGVTPSVYNIQDAIVTEATSTSFSIAGTATTSYSSGGSAEIVASFTGKVYVDYLDENFIENTKEFSPVRDADGYPLETVYLVYEEWEEKNLGSDGWMISSSGNAIFNNLAVRGEINATSGNFDGFVTVNNGAMKIGSNVNSSKYASIQSFQIISNKVVLTTRENHNFLVGESVLVENTNSIIAMSPVFPASNLTVTGVSGNGTQITYTCANSLVAGSIVNILGVSPSSYNLQQVAVVSPTSTNFKIAGTTQTAYVSGGSVEVTGIPSNAVDIDGTYTITNVTANTISYSFVASNSGPFTLYGGTVSFGDLNSGIFINDNNYWYDDGKFKLGNDINSVDWDNSTLSVFGDLYARTGKIGSLDLGFQDSAWTFGTGFIRSGLGADSVVLASPALNFSGSQTILRYDIEKLVIDSEGDGLSTLYLHITVPDLETFLEAELGTTISNQEELAFSIDQYFSSKPILFRNVISGEQNIFSTTINPNLKLKTENRWLNVQSAGNYSVSLVSGSSTYATSPTANLVVLEFWGEDYGYLAYDETITSNVGDTYKWTTEQIDILAGSSGLGNYVFWTGSELAEDAPFSISTDGAISSQDLTSNTVDVLDTLSTATFVLGGHTFTISESEPEDPADGDVWIEIV
jgi:hypothetical protein